jgi:tetratricopeptide (TPR) repeat protein
MARFARHNLSQQKEDLDKSILHYTEAILLPPVSWALSQDGSFLNHVQTLFRLALALLKRSEFELPEGIKYAIEYLRYIRRFPLDSFDCPRTDVTTWLIRALGAQVSLDAGNGTQDIEEMVVLCDELLSCSTSELVPTTAFVHLREAVGVEFNRGLPTETLDQVIKCLRNAVKVRPPGSYKVVYALAETLGTRFMKAHSKEDYEEAEALLQKILEPGGCPDLFRGEASTLSIALAYGRSIFFREPEYSEVAISRLRAGSSSPSLDEEHRLELTLGLEAQTRLHFRDYSLNESLEEANSCISQLVNASSSSDWAESVKLPSWSEEVREAYPAADIQQRIEHLESLLLITPPGTESYIKYLGHLGNWYASKFHRTKDISDLEEAIKYSRLLLNATHLDHPWRINPLCFLRDILLLAFQKTGKIGYLDESITVGYDILELKTAQQTHFSATQKLVSLLLTREQLLERIEDVHEAIRLISSVIDDQFAQHPDQFRLSCQWAIIARNIGHPTTLAAYKTAMSLMQKAFSFSPTVSTQHTRLVAMGKGCQTMPLDYASYQIHLGRFEEAVETLEQGRALLWSEMRGLRTPVCQLIEEDSPLAKRFAEINQELETLTISVTPSGRPEVEDSVGQGKDGTDPFGRLVIKRMKLVEERDTLISQIQSRPGSEGFLRAPSWSTLRSAASCGPVVIVNHCEWRSDIIIIFHNSPPCSIPTPETFFANANNLRDELVKARKHSLDSGEYQDALCTVLKRLYELVGKPVIEWLRKLSVPEQSRIWWCPTSVFCSLPLHAMGPIPSSKPEKPRYFSDLYIPSYTPSLSALIDSRRASPRTLEKPSLLLIAQPDHDLPGVKGEIKVLRKLGEQVSVTDLVSSDATPISVIEGLQGSQFAHFACHGVLETGKPFEASFKLHGASRLTLLEIVRSRLPDAEFAFLSCCHAAEITAESVSDETLHLTAAMQYCGFRSVVGTMWEMADTDGQDLAKNFTSRYFRAKTQACRIMSDRLKR